MSDDWLREASDPATPGDRLQAILDEMGDRQNATRRFVPEMLPVWEAVLANPSCPLTLLRGVLLAMSAKHPASFVLAVWHSPAVPLLLLAEPMPAYREAAWLALVALEREQGADPGEPYSPALTLDEKVASWARSTSDPALPAGHQTVRAFGRHLAGLFSLPWPDGP